MEADVEAQAVRLWALLFAFFGSLPAGEYLVAVDGVGKVRAVGTDGRLEAGWIKREAWVQRIEARMRITQRVRISEMGRIGN